MKKKEPKASIIEKQYLIFMTENVANGVENILIT